MELTGTITQSSGLQKENQRGARSWLSTSGKIWFVITVIGQWIFASYVLLFYGGSAASGEVDRWSEVLPHGMIEGDALGNVALAGHLFLAVIILFLDHFNSFHNSDLKLLNSTGGMVEYTFSQLYSRVFLDCT
ncbi:MAG: hypothetical protein AAFN93_09760 [Bacteroidota bacterium]